MSRHRLLPAVATISIVALLACGDNTAPPCDPERDVENWRIAGCPAALLFASRDTADLLPSQPEVDRYFDRWRRTITAEPILTTSMPQLYRVHGSFTIYTTNPQLIDAWSQKVLETGDLELDEMLAQIGASLVAPARESGSGYRATFKVTHLFNEEFLAASLLVRSSSMTEPELRPSNDGTWVWTDSSERAGDDVATAKIDFRFGWGDCFAGCLGFRYLQAIVPPDGPAMVFDLGGNPLPPYLSLSPNTKQPP